jgi:hypothetical protein
MYEKTSMSIGWLPLHLHELRNKRHTAGNARGAPENALGILAQRKVTDTVASQRGLVMGECEPRI